MTLTLRFIALAILALGYTVSATAGDDLATQVDLPYERFELENGLTVLLHSDHSTPTVFVGMWYGVGSKNEPEGKTGFGVFHAVHGRWCYGYERYDQRG